MISDFLLCVFILFIRLANCDLLLSTDFDCSEIGCNATNQPTNYTFWRYQNKASWQKLFMRWSTTGSHQSFLTLQNATQGRKGNEVRFSVDFCPPPDPNPKHFGCYRSELALQRSKQNSLIDWTRINTYFSHRVALFGKVIDSTDLLTTVKSSVR